MVHWNFKQMRRITENLGSVCLPQCLKKQLQTCLAPPKTQSPPHFEQNAGFLNLCVLAKDNEWGLGLGANKNMKRSGGRLLMLNRAGLPDLEGVKLMIPFFTPLAGSREQKVLSVV